MRFIAGAHEYPVLCIFDECLGERASNIRRLAILVRQLIKYKTLVERQRLISWVVEIQWRLARPVCNTWDYTIRPPVFT